MKFRPMGEALCPLKPSTLCHCLPLPGGMEGNGTEHSIQEQNQNPHKTRMMRVTGEPQNHLVESSFGKLELSRINPSKARQLYVVQAGLELGR